MQQGAAGSSPAADEPSGMVERAKSRFRWLWMLVGCTRPELGFLARSSEVRKWLLDPLAPHTVCFDVPLIPGRRFALLRRWSWIGAEKVGASATLRNMRVGGGRRVRAVVMVVVSTVVAVA
jgi:hypothetical protein